MKVTFDKAFEFAMLWERYLSNVPGDPGGLTIWGIASRYWPTEVAAMQAMSKDASRNYAKSFYLREFWSKLSCDELPYPLDMVVFDTGVNCGVSRAQRFLSETTDWIDYLMLRLNFYNSSSREDLDDGWMNRIHGLDDAKPGLYWFIRRDAHPITDDYRP